MAHHAYRVPALLALLALFGATTRPTLASWLRQAPDVSSTLTRVVTVADATSDGCGHAWQGGADVHGTLPFDGMQRTYLLHVPASYNPSTPWPLVLNLPGLGENGREQAALSHMSRTADDMHALVVYPDATQHPKVWDVGRGQFAKGVDDVGFLSALVSTLEGELCVDTRRIAATGISNGAVMDYYLACAGVTWLSVIAPVAGSMPRPQQRCTLAHHTPLLAFNGEKDPLVPYTGRGRFEPSISQVVTTWAQAQECPTPGHPGFSQGDVLETVYAPCPGNTETDLYSITDGGHAWPGGLTVPALGKTTQVIDASSQILSFVQMYPQS